MADSKNDALDGATDERVENGTADETSTDTGTENSADKDVETAEESAETPEGADEAEAGTPEPAEEGSEPDADKADDTDKTDDPESGQANGSSDNDSDPEPTGVSRWKKNADAEGKKKGRKNKKKGKGRRKKKRRPRRRLPKGAGTQIFVLLVAVALIACSVFAAWPFSDYLAWGLDFEGGTSYTYTTDSEDVDISDVADVVSTRIEKMGLSGVSVNVEDDAIVIEVPSSVNDADAIAEAVMVGELELVRLDDVSDADAILRIQNGSADVTLEDGTYEAFIDSSQITSASAYLTSSSSTTYGLTLSFDSDAATTFEEVTTELASVYGQILIVVDGTVLSSPSVSSAISGGEVSVSAGLTEAEATGIVAALETGTLPCTLTLDSTSTVSAVAGTSLLVAALIVAAAVGLVLLVVLVVWMRLLGLMTWLGLVALCAYELGGLALLSRYGVFVPSVTAYAAAGLAALVAFAVCLYYVAGMRARLRSGMRSRWVPGETIRAQYREILVVAAVLVAGGVLLYFVYPYGGFARFPSALCLPAAVLAAALSVVLVTLPTVRLAFLGSMAKHPGAWGVAPKKEKKSEKEKKADADAADAAQPDEKEGAQPNSEADAADAAQPDATADANAGTTTDANEG